MDFCPGFVVLSAATVTRYVGPDALCEILLFMTTLFWYFLGTGNGELRHGGGIRSQESWLLCPFLGWVTHRSFANRHGFARRGLEEASSSYLFETIFFAFPCIATVQLWGYGALLIGLFLAGVSVVPIAFLAAVFHGAWLF